MKNFFHKKGIFLWGTEFCLYIDFSYCIILTKVRGGRKSMLVEKRIVKVTDVPEEYRLIVISDIHAHQEAFNQLLHQIDLRDEDYLIILGDFIEKGPSSLEMLYKIRDLKKRERTYVVMGNCEAAILELLTDEGRAEGLVHYLNRTSWGSLLKDSCEALNLNWNQLAPAEVQSKLRHYLAKEIEILKSLDTAVVFDQFVFVHAGVENREDWENSSLSSMLEQQFFMSNGHAIKDKYVVCGHLPVSNYSDTLIDNSIIISHRQRIISIDGGMGVKDICQLNGLVIQKEDDGYLYFQHHVDEFDKCEVTFRSHPKFESVVKVSWPDMEIEVLQVGTSFSWCRKLSTKELVFIKNEFIYEQEGHYYCKDDYVSSMIEVQVGDRVSLVGIYGKYAYVMKEGKVGWIKADRLRKITYHH